MRILNDDKNFSSAAWAPRGRNSLACVRHLSKPFSDTVRGGGGGKSRPSSYQVNGCTYDVEGKEDGWPTLETLRDTKVKMQTVSKPKKRPSVRWGMNRFANTCSDQGGSIK